MARSERDRVIRSASMEAARLHARLHTDFSTPVDVFRIVQELHLWLATEPLGNLFGFYLRKEDAAGIVLNSKHPEDLQRYTCAHELGHHILGHSSHLDDDGTVYGSGSNSLTEHAAQVFAGAFLMPLGLVNRVVRNLGLQGSPLTASDVYEISRDMDVSFTAAVWRLRALDRLGQATAASYVRDGAAAAKASLRGSPPLGPARGDLYVVADPVNHFDLDCRVGDEIRLRLSENRSTGYAWTLSIDDRLTYASGPHWDGHSSLTERPPRAKSTSPDRFVLEVAHDDDAPDLGNQPSLTVDDLGSTAEPRIREIALIANDEGEQAVTLEMRRPWQQSAHAAVAAELAVTVRPEHQLDGYSPQQVRAHAERVARLR